MPGAGVTKIRELPMQVYASWCGHAIGDGNLIDAAAERTDVCTLMPKEMQALHDQVGDRGLAVRTGHAADLDALRRRIEKAIGDRAKLTGEIGYRDYRNVPLDDT